MPGVTMAVAVLAGIAVVGGAESAVGAVAAVEPAVASRAEEVRNQIVA